jgi:hypothetical protein
MTNFYKLPQEDLYWKITDETTTVIQTKNSIDAKGISITTSAVRYNNLINHVASFTTSNETEFNTVFAEILNILNN